MDARAIVVGTDGTAAGNAAVLHAAETARARGARLHVVSVYALNDSWEHRRDRRDAPADYEYSVTPRIEAELVAAEARDTAAELGVGVVVHIAKGGAIGTLRRLARRIQAQLIVVGTDGVGGGGLGGPALDLRLGLWAACPVEVIDVRRTIPATTTTPAPAVPAPARTPAPAPAVGPAVSPAARAARGPAPTAAAAMAAAQAAAGVTPVPAIARTAGRSPRAARRRRTEAGTTTAVADPRRPWTVLAVTTIAVFMAFLDVTIVNTAFPAIRREFDTTSLGDLSWVLNAYNVAFAALLIPAGRLADRLGRLRMFYLGLGIFLLGSTACGLAPSAWSLVTARVLQAVGAALLVPSSLGLALPEFAPDKRATAASVWAAAGAVAAATGPSLGGLLVEHVSWRAAFLVNLVIALAIPFGARILVERREADSGTPDWTGGVLLAAGTGALALAIVKAPEWGWGSPSVALTVLVSAGLVTAVVRRSRTHPSPILEGELLGIRSFAVAGASFFLFSMAFFALLLGNILFLTSVWQYDILKAGFAVTPGALAAVPGAAIAGRLTERFGPRAVAVPATFLFAVACLAYRHAGTFEPHYVSGWLPAQLLSGLAIGATFSSLATASVLDLPADRLATGTSLVSCFRQLGAVLGIAILVAVIGSPNLFDIMDVFHRAWLLEAVAALAACGAALAFGAQRLPKAVEDAARAAELPALPLPDKLDVLFPRREVSLHGHTIAYRQAGSGPVLVLLHGLFDASSTWRRVAEPLSREFTVIAPDLQGHGTSTAPSSADYSIGAHAAMVRDLLTTLGHRRVTIAGHSMGGGVAMMFAYSYPERCERLVLVSSGGLGREVHAALRLTALPGSAVLMRAASTKLVVKALCFAGRHGVPGLQDVATVLARLRRRDARDATLATLRAVVSASGQRASALDRLHLLSGIPLLILWGGGDRVIPVEHGVAGHEVHRDSRMVVLDGVGHLPHLTKPQAVADAIVSFRHETVPAHQVEMAWRPLLAGKVGWR